MQACAQKITLASTIDLQSLADETSGYSGADLQALIYNAHLEAVHDQMESSVGKSTKIGDQVTQLVYRTDSNTNTNGVFTAAEQKAYEDKVRVLSTLPLHWYLLFDTPLFINSYGACSEAMLSQVTQTNQLLPRPKQTQIAQRSERPLPLPR